MSTLRATNILLSVIAILLAVLAFKNLHSLRGSAGLISEARAASSNMVVIKGCVKESVHTPTCKESWIAVDKDGFLQVKVVP